MIRIISVEDDAWQQAQLCSYLMRYGASHGVEIKTECYPNGASFLAAYHGQAEIIFLDIQMQGLSGYEVAEQLRANGDPTMLVFITNLIQYAVKGYRVEAAEFLVKPLNEYDFNATMTRLIKRLTYRHGPTLTIQADGRLLRLPMREIAYIEVRDRRLIYHVADYEYATWEAIRTVEAKLSKEDFIRCHGSFLVQLGWIQSCDDELILRDGTKIPISRAKKAEVKKQLLAYLLRNGDVL